MQPIRWDGLGSRKNGEVGELLVVGGLRALYGHLGGLMERNMCGRVWVCYRPNSSVTPT